jgi:hypothetical protein
MVVSGTWADPGNGQLGSAPSGDPGSDTGPSPRRKDADTDGDGMDDEGEKAPSVTLPVTGQVISTATA